MHTETPSDDEAFANLVRRAHSCRLCPEMEGCTRVLSDANGPTTSNIMFIGEAPGRLGAERTAVPFHGDVAGDNFETLLALAGLSRNQVFVTNAILCNPTDASGNNTPPTKQSVRNCSKLLAEQIETINPALIVTLGAAALNALSLIQPHILTVSSSVRTLHNWNERKLIPLYHPGARALIHRNFAAQTADYYFVGETYRRIFSKTRIKSNPPERNGWNIVRHILSEKGTMSLFQLHKIMYLLDYNHSRLHNKRLTDFFYIRQKDGPYCVELGTRWYKKFESVHSSFRTGVPTLTWKGDDLFSNKTELSEDIKNEIHIYLSEIGSLSDSQLKTRAYLTEPMKRALRAERAGQIGLNRALL